jgi:hypothetical protein
MKNTRGNQDVNVADLIHRFCVQFRIIDCLFSSSKSKMRIATIAIDCFAFQAIRFRIEIDNSC